MIFTVKIECDNAAFCDESGIWTPEEARNDEIRTCLRKLIKDLYEYPDATVFSIRDSNGNRVGQAKFTEDI